MPGGDGQYGCEVRAVLRDFTAILVTWGLRDYGIPAVDWADGWHGVYGLEPTPEAFIAHSVEVFAELRRVLRDDGTLWLNIGDSYAQDTKWGGTTGGKHAKGLHGTTGIGRNRHRSGLKPGDLCNMPHRVAAALQADGWYWRSTIIWSKRSPMPESISGWRWRRCMVKVGRKPVDWKVTPKGWDVGQGAHDEIAKGNYRQNGEREKTVAVYEPCPGCAKCEPNGGYVLRRGKWRPTTAHEYVFLFSKSERYFCDGDAVQELSIGERNDQRGDNRTPKGSGKRDPTYQTAIANATERRNPRSVWTLSSEPHKGAHFATFPTKLVKRCIEAATSAKGCCPVCEASYAPIVESERVPTRPAIDNKLWKAMGADALTQRTATSPNLDPERHVAVTRVLGYRPTCNCGASEAIGSVVFDPFAGSGTTLQVAKFLGRRWLGAEISQDYAELAEVRINTPPRWAQHRPQKPKQKVDPNQRSLFA